MGRPNIVLIVADQFRGDCLGFAGHPDVKTPYLDTLAARGMYFPNMYSACPSRIPARAALLTGMSQARNGRVGYQDGIDWNYAHTLAGELAELGYNTHCVGKMHVHPPRSRMGFHDVEIHDGYLHYYRREDIPAYQAQDRYDDFLRWLRDQKGMDRDMNDAGVECVSWIARPWPYEERLHPTNWATERAIDFLRRRDHREPFFLMVSYVRPHPPFDAPACYFDMYRDMDIAPPISGDWDDPELLKEFGRMFNGRSGPADPELIRQAQIGYYACITHLDHQLDRLLEVLQYTGDTLIMFTADHGEMLCDHHRFGKSVPYRGSANVPLIVSGFGKYAAAFRGTNPRLGELRDILPTLVAQAGGGECPFSDGENLLGGDEGREYLHGEHNAGESSNHFIVTAHDKYIWFSQTGGEQYFDLDADPRETHDAFADPQYARRIAYLRALLVKELEGREEGYVADGRLVVGKAPAKRVAESEKIEPEARALVEDNGLLKKLNKEYEIEFVELKLIRDWIGRTYAAAASDGKRYVLKLFRPQYAAEAVMSAGVMTHLRRNGVSVPEVIATLSGAPEFECGGMTAALYEFIDGVGVERDGRLSALGALSRRMAECMAGYRGDVPTHGKEFFIDRYTAIMRRVGYPHAREFEELGRRLWAQAAQLPAAFCHGDFHCGNMFLRGGEIVVYDFDACALCTPTYDAATICDATDYFSLETENFVSGYRRTLENAREFAKGRGLSEAELNAVPACVAIRHYDIQATIIDIVGHGRPDFDFLDSQLEWLQSWTRIFM